MKGVNNEASNTEKMQAHALKSRATQDATIHEDVDLMVCTDLINQARTHCLNADAEYASIFEVLQANPDDKALASDADQQLLMKIEFKERVNVSAVALRFNTPPSAEDSDELFGRPRLIKLFANKEDLDFGDVSEGAAAVVCTVEGEETEVRIQCLGHRFQRMGSLQIFVEEAFDVEDEPATKCFLNRVSIMGHRAASYHSEYS